jgi:hypothetical protein
LKKFRIILLLFGSIFLLISCEKIIFSGEGEVTVKSEKYEQFSMIEINDIFNVELKSDSSFGLDIVTEFSYLEKISVSLDSGILRLSDNNRYKWLPDYPRPTIIISFPYLDGMLILNSPVNLFTLDTLVLPALKIQSLGKAGEFDLIIDVDMFQLATGSDNAAAYIIKGKAVHSRIWPRGSSVIDASELYIDSAYVYNNSIGDCSVSVNNSLEVRLNALGNIYYYGNPQINIIEESGSGKLLKGE